MFCGIQSIDSHIEKSISAFASNQDEDFETIFELVTHPQKKEFLRLLKYFSRLIDLSVTNNAEDLKYTHLHLTGVSGDVARETIGEFLGIKLFVLCLKNASTSNSDNLIKREIRRLTTRLAYFPEGVTGKSKEAKQILAKRKVIRRLKAFYETLQNKYPSKEIVPKVLLNVSRSLQDYFHSICGDDHFLTDIDLFDKRPSSYVCTNFAYSRDELDRKRILGKPILDFIEHLVLFDCEEKSVHRQFNFKELSDWNNQGAAFRNLLVISLTKAGSFIQIKSSLERIQARFYGVGKFPDYNAFAMHPSESSILLGLERNKFPDVLFFGEPRISFWDDFRAEISNLEGLNELQSIKLRNIYSLVSNIAMRDLLLTLIFGSHEQPNNIINEETKKVIRELSDASLEKLRRSLSLTLDGVIRSGVFEVIKTFVKSASTVVLPFSVLGNVQLLQEVKRQFEITEQHQLVTWSDLNIEANVSVLALAYRDPGPFPYQFKPNLVESPGAHSSITGIFLKCFFEQKYLWLQYALSRDMQRLFNHSFRKSFFDWDSLETQINVSKPSDDLEVDWDIESDHVTAGDHVTYRVRFSDPVRVRTYYTSELFIVRVNGSTHFMVKSLEELLLESFEGDMIEGQCLDELHADLNLYERLANIEREERELDLIRLHYNLQNNISASSLWKVLLMKKRTEVTNIYETVQSFMAKDGTQLVSKYTFENNWLNFESDTLIPREKKQFHALCQYLELPTSYYRLMLRKKNAERQQTRRSTRQMNKLLSDLINDGCFDPGADVSRIINDKKASYVKRHDFDEIGISSDQIVGDMQTLVQLLTPYLKLSIVAIER